MRTNIFSKYAVEAVVLSLVTGTAVLFAPACSSSSGGGGNTVDSGVHPGTGSSTGSTSTSSSESSNTSNTSTSSTTTTLSSSSSSSSSSSTGEDAGADSGGAGDYGVACSGPGSQSTCTGTYDSCQMIMMADICTKACTTDSDCPSPPTSGTCNMMGYCK